MRPAVRIEQTTSLDLIGRLETLTPEDEKTFNTWLLATAHLWVGSLAGRLVCCWGLVPPTLLADTAFLWLYTTPAVEAHKFLFVRHSQIAVKQMLEMYPTIVGLTARGNEPAKRWIRWLGGEYAKPQGEFMPFTIKREASRG